MGCFPGIQEPGRRGVLRQRTGNLEMPRFGGSAAGRAEAVVTLD
jgi:hypothetical protein